MPSTAPSPPGPNAPGHLPQRPERGARAGPSGAAGRWAFVETPKPRSGDVMVRCSVPMHPITGCAFPHRVDIEVPGDGLGERYRRMGRWLDAHLRRGTYHHHRHIERPVGTTAKDFARFLFLDEDAAESFHRTWGGRRARRPGAGPGEGPGPTTASMQPRRPATATPFSL